MSISVVSVGAQQLVASQSVPPSSQTSTADASPVNASAKVNAPSAANSTGGAAQNNTNGSGANPDTSDAPLDAILSEPKAREAQERDQSERATLIALGASSGARDSSNRAASTFSDATPKSQVDAKTNAKAEDGIETRNQQEEAQAVRDFERSEEARIDEEIERLEREREAARPVGPDEEAPPPPPLEVAVPDTIPDRLPPRVGLTG